MLASIVIPTWRNPEAVNRCLAAIAANTPEPHEILIIDNGVTPRGCVAASNQGLRAARGDMLVVLNDDCQPQPGWLGALSRELEQGHWMWGCEWRYALMSGHCLCLSREGYEHLGGFDERYIHWNADHDLELRAYHAGHPPVQNPNAHVVHDPADPLRAHNLHGHVSPQAAPIGPWQTQDQETFVSIWGDERPADHWPSTTPPFR